MEIIETFDLLLETPGRNDKERILKESDSPLLRRILEYTYNPYKQYHIKKVPQTDKHHPRGVEDWGTFLEILDSLNERKFTGNQAIELVHGFLNDQPLETEFWMRRVIDRHLNVGITSSTINKVFKKLVPAFKVQLAHHFEEKRVKDCDLVGFEPKLDGVRCIAILRNGHAVLHSRNGKPFSQNYDNTIIKDLERLAEEGRIDKDIVFDGELMGSDFTSTVSQIHRKSKVDVSDQFYNVFDWMPYGDWVFQKSTINCQKTREMLEDMHLDSQTEYIKIVHRDVMPPSEYQKMHDVYVEQGYEGVMIKTLDTFYKFKRGHNVMKFKAFLDVDLEVVGFEEGEGRNAGVLGAIIVKNNKWDKYPDGVRVNVGSGFSDADRKDIWENRTKFRGMIAEVRYQTSTDPGHGPNGETPDGSLRFPTFRGWRPDKK
jgi:DNA ligase-1